MSLRAEYMQCAVDKGAVKDLATFSALLYEYLLANIQRQYLNRIRSIHLSCADEGDYLYIDTSFAARSLISFQQTKNRREFFLEVTLNVYRFFRFFSVQP